MRYICNKLLEKHQEEINKFNIIFITQFFFVFPLLIIPEILFFIKEDVFEVIKLIEYIFFLVFVFINCRKILLKTYLSVILLILLNIIVTSLYRPIDDLLNMLVRIIPFLALFISPYAFSNINFRSLIKQISLYNLFLFFFFIILLLVLPAEGVRWQQDLSRFIGLRSLELPFLFSDNLHNTAHLIIILIIPFFYQRNYKSYIGIFLGLILLSLYTVRVTQLAFFILLSYYLISHINTLLYRKIVAYIAIFSAIAVIMYSFSTIDISVINSFVSGRFFSWSERLNIFLDYNYLEILFGKGYGSDCLITKQWGEIPKNAHNDYLGYLFWGGVISVLCLVLILFSISKVDKFFLLILLLLTLFSNGLFVRPIHFMYIVFLWKFISSFIPDPWHYNERILNK